LTPADAGNTDLNRWFPARETAPDDAPSVNEIRREALKNMPAVD
jgi:hypothetical protein